MSETGKIVVARVMQDDDHDEAHGGAWKVAYADFMTALMTFFLLMWILATTDEKKLEGLAEYFTPSYEKSEGLGGQGALGGTAPEEKGVLARRMKPAPQGEANPGEIARAPVQNPWAALTQSPEQALPPDPAARPVPEPLYLPGIEAEPGFAERQNGLPGSGMGPADGARDPAANRAMLADLAQSVARRLETDPSLAPIAGSVEVVMQEDGLRLEIVDQADLAMFGTGSATFSPEIAGLMARLGATLAPLPNRIVVTGHTDTVPFRGGQDYTNWELSTDRANATRRALIAAGVDPARFRKVSGVADTDPLHADDPADPRNRRVTVHLVLAAAELPAE